MKYAKKRDGNERAVISALVAMGCTVSQLGDPGIPDLLVGYLGQTILLEVKDPSQGSGANKRRASGGAGVRTMSQVKWWGQPWNGGVRAIVSTPEDACAIVRGATAPARSMLEHAPENLASQLTRVVAGAESLALDDADDRRRLVGLLVEALTTPSR